MQRNDIIWAYGRLLNGTSNQIFQAHSQGRCSPTIPKPQLDLSYGYLCKTINYLYFVIYGFGASPITGYVVRWLCPKCNLIN
jgi:hypothetical protein